MLRTFWYRLTLLFRKKMNNIDELMAFDKAHNIPSVFFFGMSSVLGMSYSQQTAIPFIKKVMKAGFDVGVHGVDYLNADIIKKEHDDFAAISGLKNFGLRNHYVRFDNETFVKQANAGYIFDSTWFNKKQLDMRAPYKVKNMWEFPLHIMDGYICFPGRLKEGLKNTFAAIKKAEEIKMPYCTILYHDPQFNDSYDPQMKKWYEETVSFIEKNGYAFISYRDAIKELEQAK